MGAGASCFDDTFIEDCLASSEVEYQKLEESDEIVLCCIKSDKSSQNCKTHQNPEVEKKILAKISKIKQADHSFHMERKILKQNKNKPIGRSSSPSEDSCNDQHMEKYCNLSEFDEEDLLVYPRWKSYLEHTKVNPVDKPIIPEAVSAGSTPNWFPPVTSLDPAESQQQSQSNQPKAGSEPKRSSPCPDRTPTKVFYYLTVLNELDNELEVTPEQRPTPYQLYMQQQQQQQSSSSKHNRRFVVWTPSDSSSLKDGSSDQTPPPPVPRELKPKQGTFHVVRTYRRVKDADRRNQAEN